MTFLCQCRLSNSMEFGTAPDLHPRPTDRANPPRRVVGSSLDTARITGCILDDAMVLISLTVSRPTNLANLYSLFVSEGTVKTIQSIGFIGFIRQNATMGDRARGIPFSMQGANLIVCPKASTTVATSSPSEWTVKSNTEH